MPEVSAQITEPGAGFGARSHTHLPAPQLLPLVYDELRRLARHYMRGENHDHTLQPTDLVHEAYLKLASRSQVNWHGRTHFLAVGARVMRCLLVDHARARRRQRRGGDRQRVTLDELRLPTPQDLDPEDLLALNAALEKLARLDARQARIVELRSFGGLRSAEVAVLLGISERTVERDWLFARAWLRRELSSSAPGPGAKHATAGAGS